LLRTRFAKSGFFVFHIVLLWPFITLNARMTLHSEVISCARRGKAKLA
jgi:hypothetical protein